MKIIPLATLSTVIACILAGCAPLATVDQPYPIRIGATQSELKGAIGKANQGKVGDEHCVMQKWVWVRAGFENGVCDCINYASNTKFSSADVSRILSFNSAGVRWIIERTSKENNKVYYRSGDLKYRAVLTNESELFIVSDKRFQTSMSELLSEKRKLK